MGRHSAPDEHPQQPDFGRYIDPAAEFGAKPVKPEDGFDYTGAPDDWSVGPYAWNAADKPAAPGDDDPSFGYEDAAFDPPAPTGRRPLPSPSGRPPRPRPAPGRPGAGFSPDAEFSPEAGYGLDDDDWAPATPRRRADADIDPWGDELLDEIRARRPALGDEFDGDDDEDARAKAPGQESKPSRKFKAIAAVVGSVAAVAFFANFSHDTSDNANDMWHQHSGGTHGANKLPATPVDGEPMDTAAQRAASVQRAVNNGDHGKTVDAMLGTASFTDANGDKAKVTNPIIVMDGLGSDYDKLGKADPSLFKGHIFGIEPVSYDAHEGAGESYKVVDIDPSSITSWKPAKGTKGKLPVKVEVGWTEETAGEAINPDNNQPLHDKNGKPLVVGDIE